MLLKYTGPKQSKKIEYNDRVFVFAPECEVDDMTTVKFLLDPDRKGLFEIVKKQPAAPKESLADSEPEEAKSESKRVRPRKYGRD